MLKPKAGIFLVLIGALALSGCSLIRSVDTNIPARPVPAMDNSATGSVPVTSSEPKVTSSTISSDANKAATDTAAVLPKSITKTFEIVAKNWEFVPGTITVNKGDTVKLVIKSVDVDHGFAMPAFGINRDLKPGTTETIEFVADKVGSFPFRCSVYCGNGHREMDGTLIVQ